jgi:GNAT superfamily N-acetyltransferase
MSRLEFRAFSDDHLDGAGALLAARHRAHRTVEPLLSERFESDGAARGEVAVLWAEEHASGAVALRAGRVAGFLLGTRKTHNAWGANVWVEAAGYAADDPELVRDLYAVAAERWVDEGRTRHYVLVPSLSDQVDPWFRLGFGAQQAHGIREVAGGEWPPGTRRARSDDLDALLELVPLISEHHLRAPTFSGLDWDEDPDELRAMVATEIADPELGELLYERDGLVVAHFELTPAGYGSMHRGPDLPESAALLNFAATLPDARGSGAGLALTEAAFAWAHEQGYAAMLTDWRETNLLSSRFWPARGFRRSFLRLYRSIP